MDLGLQGRVAIVTGASSNGIGRAIAGQLADEGAHVAIVARRKRLLLELRRDIAERTGNTPLVICADLTQKKAARAIRDQVLRAFGKVDILVNSAGGSRPLPVAAPDEQWDEALALNFTAVRRLTHSVLASMLAGRWGRIINITGTSEPPMLNAAHSAKAAVHAWAKGISLEIGRAGVTINCVVPGKILSEQIRKRIHPGEANRRAFARKNIPVGFFGDPEDVATLVAFLVSPRARYITGELIHVDGGLRRHAF
ncbi:MAG: SDR family oxidoreductase [Betaproteobacteria bacterium]|nr:SDR family oxidoreductase [Betaproteobacteria bacterium]